MRWPPAFCRSERPEISEPARTPPSRGRRCSGGWPDSTEQAVLDAVKDAHEQAGGLDCFAGFGDVCVVDLAMAGWVAQHAVSADEQGADGVLLAFRLREVCKWPARAEGLVHQIRAVDVVTEAGQLAGPD